MNEKNLIPLNKRTKSEQREIVKKGGKKSGEVRRQKKTMSELAKIISEAPVSTPNKKILKTMGIKAEDATNAALPVMGVFKQAAKGSVQAFEKWQQLTEDTKINDGEYCLPAKHIGSAFVDINRSIQPNMEYVFSGGRGSLKSSYVGFKLIELIKNNPNMSACVVRKISNTIKDSVYAQIKWCIIQLGLEEEFTFTVSPMEITYKKTGQVIYFRGADDPAKLKSIKPVKGYLGILWFEEVDQFKGDEELRNIQQSVLRGGDEAYLFKSFNPPKSKNNFMNQYIRAPKANMVVHKSNYKQSPIEWLGEFFLNEAEHLKEVNPIAYENEYMGIANGTGGLVFENLEVRAISDKEIAKFDRIYQGLDFGWYPDPLAFLRVSYEADEETVYIFAEFGGNKWSNEKTADEIKTREYDDFRVTCDSAEPKSISDLIGFDIPAVGAVKGPGSIDYGFKWLQRRKIVIDPARCPNAHKELSEYEYEKDKDGNDISGYPDGNDHWISALRYALERCMNFRGNSA